MSEIHATTHRHPDDRGWLRPAVFGAMDGLVSNFALIMGVLGGSTHTKPAILAGLAGVAAGACSMAAGEYTSVASQAEFIEAQVAVERQQIRTHNVIEQAELAERFVALGIDGETAERAAASIHADPQAALEVHSLTEFGVRPGDYPSPVAAAVASFFSFAIGAMIPLAPLLMGITSAVPTIVASLIALFVCGAVITRVTARNWLYGGVRQLVLGAAAAALTYVIGDFVGATLG